MNRKNLILTMLACLNCVHTTHAVESKNADTQIINQGNGQESLDKLAQQLKLQNLRIFWENKENLLRNAAIQREEIIQKMYEHKKDALPPHDPLWSFYEKLIKIRREIVEDLSNPQPDDNKRLLKVPHTRFDNKIKEWVDSRKINGIKGLTVEKTLGDVEETLPILYDGDVGHVPTLILVSHPKSRHATEMLARASEQDRLAKKYPGIAKKKRDLYRKWWAFALNVNIKAGNWRFDNLRAGINQLDESNTEIGRDMKKTILNTIRNNLIGEDQDLAEKTMALLKQDPVLKQMIKLDGPEMKKILTDPRLALLKTKDKIQGPLKKVKKGPFLEVAKYL